MCSRYGPAVGVAGHRGADADLAAHRRRGGERAPRILAAERGVVRGGEFAAVGRGDGEREVGVAAKAQRFDFADDVGAGGHLDGEAVDAVLAQVAVDAAAERHVLRRGAGLGAHARQHADAEQLQVGQAVGGAQPQRMGAERAVGEQAQPHFAAVLLVGGGGDLQHFDAGAELHQALGLAEAFAAEQHADLGAALAAERRDAVDARRRQWNGDGERQQQRDGPHGSLTRRSR